MPSSIERPLGMRFSHVYLERSSPQRDSERARARIAAYYPGVIESYDLRASQAIREELGANVWHMSYTNRSLSVPSYLKSAPLAEFLDAISIISKSIAGPYHWNNIINGSQPMPSVAQKIIVFCNRVFREENLIYEVDRCGGVHTYIDAEFQRARLSTLAVLEPPEHAAAKFAYEQCFVALDCVPPDTLTACRRMFEAAEVAVKALFPDKRISVLGANEIDRIVRSAVLGRFASDPVARNNANELINGIRAWVNGLQAYRHGQHAEEPVAPPFDLAIALISNGASYLRFLIETLGSATPPPAIPSP